MPRGFGAVRSAERSGAAPSADEGGTIFSTNRLSSQPQRGVLSWPARHPVAAAAAAALLIRLAAAVVSFIVHRPWLIPDESQYIELAATVARGEPAENWVRGYGQSLYDLAWAFLAPLRLIFDLFWPSRLFGQLWAALLGAATAALVVKIALAAVDARIALAAGLAVAVFPSQVLWSSVVLRESAVWAGLALVALGVATAASSRGVRLLLSAVVTACGLIALGHLRPTTLVAASWALAAAVVVLPSRQRAATAVGGVALAALVPAVTGLGIFGLTFVTETIGDTGEVRARLAEGAESAFVDTREDPAGGDAQLEPSLRHLPKGLIAVTLRPFPWEEPTSTGVSLARLENVAWVLLYLAAVAGVVLGRRAWAVMAFPFFFIGGFVASAALTQGNLGTAFRHRGQILWALVLLAAIGAAEVQARRRSDTGAPSATAGSRSPTAEVHPASAE